MLTGNINNAVTEQSVHWSWTFVEGAQQFTIGQMEKGKGQYNHNLKRPWPWQERDRENEQEYMMQKVILG